MDILPPVAKNKFLINRPRDDGKAIPQLPTLGVDTAHPLSDTFGIDSADAYVAALHGAIGGLKQAYEGSIAEAAKALGATPPQALAYGRLSFMPDPANYGLMQWPGIQPESLRKIAQENLLPQMVIRSRVSDIRRYSCLSTHIWSPGWKIVLTDSKKTPTAKDKQDIADAEQFIVNCSMEKEYRDPRVRDEANITDFERFLCGAVDDSLTFDGWAVWTNRDRSGRIRSFANMPAGLIRLAIPGKGYKGNPNIYAALVDDTGTPVAAFDRDELVWSVRNVRNDPNVIGYGWSELEMAIKAIQGYQAGVELNVDGFTRSSIPNGLLMLKGDFWQQEQIDAMTREWTNMKRGLSKLWGMPIIGIPENSEIELLQFMDLKGQEVRFKDHMNMMVGIYCIMAQFPIRRFGMFASGNRRDSEPAQDGAVEVQGVDDPGMPAFLTFLEHRINPYLLQPNWPQLRLMFMNKNPKEDARAYEAMKNARTWKEARAEVDIPSLVNIAPTWLKSMMEIVELCPQDPSLTGMYSALAVEMLKDKLGLNDVDAGMNPGSSSGSDPKVPGAAFPSKKDPAQSQAHGHRAGVRRDSKKEAGALPSSGVNLVNG